MDQEQTAAAVGSVLRLTAMATSATRLLLVSVAGDELTVHAQHPEDGPSPSSTVVDFARRVAAEETSAGASSLLGVRVGPESDASQRLDVLVLVATSDQIQRWTEAERSTLHDAAASLSTLQELDQQRKAAERQLRAERRRRQVERRVGSLAAAANEALSTSDTAEALAEHASPIVGASVISLAVVDDDEVMFFHGPGITSDVASDWETAPVDTEVPMVYAAVHAQAVIIPSRKEFDRWPAMRPYIDQLNLHAFAALPINDDELGLRACIGMGFDQPLEQGRLPQQVDRLLALSSETLGRAAQFDTQSDQAETLQQVAIPAALPQTPGLAIAPVYLPPNRYRPVGGDIYDAVLAADGACVVMVADATGHDLVATKAVARVRYALGVLAQQGGTPADVLGAVNDYLYSNEDVGRYVTCAVARFDPDRSGGWLATAGHPLPRLVTPEGVQPLGRHGDPLLGLRRGHRFQQYRFEFRPTDALVLFTDGLVEALTPGRDADDRPIDGILDEILHSPSGWPQPADSILEALTKQVEDDRDDDVAIAVVTADATDLPELTMHWRSGSLSLAEVRRRLRHWLNLTLTGPTAPQDDGSLVESIELAATELLTNADRAAPDGSQIGLAIHHSDNSYKMSVSNDGESFTVDSAMPGDSQHRGRGLAIVTSVASSVEVKSNGGRTTVSAFFTT